MSRYGLDLPGLNSTVSWTPDGSRFLSEPSTRPYRPSAALLPLIRREKPVAGDQALQNDRGIGLPWPPLAQAPHLGSPGAGGQGRVLIAECWNALARKELLPPWQPPDGLPQTRAFSPAELLAWEASAVTGRFEKPPEETVLAIPNRLDEDDQQDLLDTLSNPTFGLGRVRLLWRPVAAAMSWCQGREEGGHDGTSLVVVDIGLRGIEITPLKLRLSPTVQGRRYLQPVRQTSDLGTSIPDETFWAARAADEFFQLLQGRQQMRAALELGNVPLDPAATVPYLTMSGFSLERHLAPNPGAKPHQLPFTPPGGLPGWMPVRASAGSSASKELERLIAAAEKAVRPYRNSRLLLTGPLAPLVTERLKETYGKPVELLAGNAVAEGCALFAWRLMHGLPTYLDTLPSLDLFVITEEDRPAWKKVIPEGTEVTGGEIFRQTIRRAVAVQEGTAELSCTLRRGLESGFRRLTTALPLEVEQTVRVDFLVTASSAGGRARIEMSPSEGEPPVFGSGAVLLLDWNTMEELKPNPDQPEWPPHYKPTYAFPDPGELLGSEVLLDRWMDVASDLGVAWRNQHWTFGSTLEELFKISKRSIPAAAERQAAPSHRKESERAPENAAPLASLPCFGTGFPMRVQSSDGVLRTLNEGTHQQLLWLGQQLWDMLRVHLRTGMRSPTDRDRLIEICGRMARYAPVEFVSHIQVELDPKMPGRYLFAAGRTFFDAAQGPVFVRTFAERLSPRPEAAEKTLHWLRAFAYILYQAPDALQDCRRDHVLAIMLHARAVMDREVGKNNFKTTFINALRCLALGLRYRRKAKDFLRENSEFPKEVQLFRALEQSLGNTKSAVEQRMLTRRGVLTAKGRQIVTLLERTSGWLTATARTADIPRELFDSAEEGNDED